MAGGNPPNFHDVGGTVMQRESRKAFRIILKT